MKNITITLPEEVARWARVWAAKNEQSLSRAIAELLREHMREEDEYQHAMTEYLKKKPARIKDSGSYPSREEIHDRSQLR